MFKFKKEQLDILAVGDIAVDVFIKIKEAETKCDPAEDHCELCLRYGGKIPYESINTCYAAGNSSNVSICTSKLGFKTGLISNLGDDDDGCRCLEKLNNVGVKTDFISREKDKLTNCHYVLWYGTERTILTKHQDYRYKWLDDKKMGRFVSPKWIYLSSLGENSTSLHGEILEYLVKHQEVKLAFQPGTFQIKLGKDALKDIYEHTEILLSNKQEAEKILETKNKTIPELLPMIYLLGPKTVVITDGLNGACAYDGKDIFFMKALPHTPVESTGAGDAFSGSFVGAVVLSKSISEALVWGAINAKSVVEHIGPHDGLLSRDEIEKEIKNIQVDYQPIKIN